MKKCTYIILLLGCVSIIFLQATSVTEPASKADLGKMIFFDPILSENRSISCASCHNPKYAFADSSAISSGVHGAKGVRNTPSAMNVALHRTFFWDGRARSLEEQALAPIENPIEMNLPVEEALTRLRTSDSYSRYFMKIFKTVPTRENLGDAIASFERTLETSESPFDMWKFYDDSSAVDDAVKRGFEVFNNKGKCIKCHFGSDFTSNEFRNIGLFNGLDLNDSGRTVISGRKEDIGKFKIPGLRNVAVTAPYIHNGMIRSLKEVIEFYDDPNKIVPNSINKDTLLAHPLGLTMQEKNDLEAFLLSLTDKRFMDIESKDIERINQE